MSFALSTILGTASGDDSEKEFDTYAIWAGRNPLYTSGYRYNDSASDLGAESFNVTGSQETWTVPAGVSKIRITTIGGGGSGGTRHGNNYHGGGGGGGGAFATAEYTVSAGDQLNVRAPNAASHATDHTHQYNGGQAYVQSASDSGAAINISANGGTGGSGYSAGGGSSTKQASGSALISGTSITADGGSGGQGSTLSFGFGPEPYGAAGGGAAGYVVGNGGSGASNNAGGYSTFSSGGGAIGGYSGGAWSGGGSSTSNHNYTAGSGAGSGENGVAGSTNSTPKKGGDGSNSDFPGGKYPQETGSWTPSNFAEGSGANAKRETGGAGGSSNAFFDNAGSGGSGGGGPKTYAWPLMAKAYQGGGGGGNGYSSYQYTHRGGDGGVGGGGGGGGCYQTQAWGSHANNNGYTYFDYAMGCYRPSDSGYAYQPMGYNARGGHAGAFAGGGGGGGYYGDGGGGGYGGGGGGGGGHFQGSSHGYGGMAGPALVVIEWKAP